MFNRLFMISRDPFPTASVSDVVRPALVFLVVVLVTGCATTVRKEETLAETLNGWDIAQFNAYQVYEHGTGGSPTAVVLDKPHDEYRFADRGWHKRDAEWIAALVRARTGRDLMAGRLTDDSGQLLGYVLFVGTDWRGEQGSAHLTLVERDNPGKYYSVMYSPPRDFGDNN